MWHDHSGSNKADGLQGALIVHAKGPEPWTYDEEQTIFLTDWFHGQLGSSLLPVLLPACICMLKEWLICLQILLARCADMMFCAYLMTIVLLAGWGADPILPCPAPSCLALPHPVWTAPLCPAPSRLTLPHPALPCPIPPALHHSALPHPALLLCPALPHIGIYCLLSGSSTMRSEGMFSTIVVIRH